MEKKSLYRPDYEHDACGIGFIANISGKKERLIIEQSLEMLRRLDHRAGHNGDTGDGAGILTQLPDAYFRKILPFDLPKQGDYAVGMIFIPDASIVSAIKEGIVKELTDVGLTWLGCRNVPVNKEVLKASAYGTCPHIMQVFIGKPESSHDRDFDRKLYVLRRKIEKRFREWKGFYISSLSARTIVYKGFLSPEQLGLFYTDLLDGEYRSAFALVHSRFSTNTFPSWEKAHPYRTLIHNGEINTIQGNRLWMKAREKTLVTEEFGGALEELLPIVEEDGSDSASLDNVLDFLMAAGIHPAKAVRILVPEPWEHSLDSDLTAFYEYHSALMEPWDGPMALAFTDGRFITAGLDRNGLRPGRYVITKADKLIFSSEFGVVDVDPNDVKVKAHLKPGEWLCLDLENGRLIPDSELQSMLAEEWPYAEWLNEQGMLLEGRTSYYPAEVEENVASLQKAFDYTYEEINKAIKPMVVDGKEATGSMGMDVPLAVLSERPQLLYNYFKQSFAQVTNPPIDSLREACVTSTLTWLGVSSPNLLKPSKVFAKRIKCASPILNEGEFHHLTHVLNHEFTTRTLSVLYENGDSLEKAMADLFDLADRAIREGTSIIILSDRYPTEAFVAIPMLLAVSGLHHHLIRIGKRTQVSLVVDTGEARDSHHMATLIGYGADAIHPYLGLAIARHLLKMGHIQGLSMDEASKNYIKALNGGVTKIMSKLGISTVQSYRGSQAFEALGLAPSVVDKYFTGTVSQLGGLTLKDIDKETKKRHQRAFESNGLDSGSVLQWRREGEYHRYNPKTIHTLQQAARRNDWELYKKFVQLADEESFSSIRSLLTFQSNRPAISINEVEPIESILKRFKTGAMSYGSLSKEAHEALAIAMNRIGGKSNSGEGGEDPDRFTRDPNGDWRRSAIKQVASGRFGVNSHYLTNAEEIQIKMAQGAKPGEGGQLPAKKVYPWIAEVRGSTPGVGLISPPPHHDIYSIEDLAQLIYDLKSANPNAKISVKLVAKAGVGTIAAGVAKGLADTILISGYDGGTGASPRTSIQHAGMPWELGLAETHQTLLLNGLRDEIVLEADGKLMTGRDVIVAACLGAEEFGFATAPLVVLGCIIMRMCHTDTCPVGIATQNPELRKKMMGTPEHVVNYFRFVAEDVRRRLAELGFKSIDELVGMSDILKVKSEVKEHEKASRLNFSKLLYKVPRAMGRRYEEKKRREQGEVNFDERELLKAIEPALADGANVTVQSHVRNTDRAVGTLSGHMVSAQYHQLGLPDHTIHIRLKGSAGQSFGAFVPRGMTLDLEGDANDYVGKGLSGGKIIVKPFGDREQPMGEAIIGNVAFYGATSGEAYIRGAAGGRFAVRNSGADIVVEGIGEHGCEYMTGGKVVILGRIGKNFAAGMSGGIAYIWDQHFDPNHINMDMVRITPLTDPTEAESIKQMIKKHSLYTESRAAKQILENWEENRKHFIKVIPAEYEKMLGMIGRLTARGHTVEEAKILAFYGGQSPNALKDESEILSIL
ncbi:MAG: glutamate synthase large subunit [Tuberibacillus sp.]